MNHVTQIINKLLRTLPRLSKNDIKVLTDILEDDSFRKQLIRALESLVKLHESSERFDNQVIFSENDKINTSSRQEKNIKLKKKLYEVISNKKHFQSNQDLINSLSDNFGYK